MILVLWMTAVFCGACFSREERLSVEADGFKVVRKQHTANNWNTGGTSTSFTFELRYHKAAFKFPVRSGWGGGPDQTAMSDSTDIVAAYLVSRTAAAQTPATALQPEAGSPADAAFAPSIEPSSAAQLEGAGTQLTLSFSERGLAFENCAAARNPLVQRVAATLDGALASTQAPPGSSTGRLRPNPPSAHGSAILVCHLLRHLPHLRHQSGWLQHLGLHAPRYNPPFQFQQMIDAQR